MIELGRNIIAARLRHRKELKKADKLIKRGEDAAAERIWRRYLEENPDDSVILFNMGVIVKKKGETADIRFEAAEYFSKVISNPFAELEHKADSLNNLGIIAEKSGYTEKALMAYGFALKIKPDHSAALINYGDSLRLLGDFKAADDSYAKVILAHPDSPEANYSSAYIALVMGDYQRGWKSYRHRHRMSVAQTKPIESIRPQWNGEPLAGKTLMLTEEQGYGDGFMGIRFAQGFAAMGARVVWGAQECMREVCRGATGLSDCVSRDDATEFDYHLPLLDAPHWLGITPENIPQPPYLFVRDDWPAWCPPGASGKPRIGLIWAGSPVYGRDKARSLVPEQFQPLIDDHPELEFYALQVGPRQHEVSRLRGLASDLAPTIRGWTWTAQVLEWLDLVIMVDSGVGHLAGALNRPVWLLIPNSPDWRWMLGRNDSPWYPRHTLFRQPNKDDWQTPIARINAALSEFACEKANDGLAMVP